MRRTIAGLLFFIAAVCLAVAAGGWWLQRVAFDTDVTEDAVEVALDDDQIRGELARISANAAAATVGIPPLDLRIRIEEYLRVPDPGMRASIKQIVADSQARLIGLRDEPVQITGPQLVPIVRDERVAVLPPVTLPIEKVTALNVVRIGLGWFVPIVAGAGVVALLLGLLAHPRKPDALFGIGAFCLLGAVGFLLLGYLLPAFVVPAIRERDMWLALFPAIAKASLPLVGGAALALVAAGLALMMASSAIDRRRRSWDKPISIHRRADQRRWS